MNKRNKHIFIWFVVGIFIAMPTTFVAALVINGNVTISGDLDVRGTISKGSGSFVIDHPQKPSTYLLYHSFVESPDVKNIYTGVVVLGKDGKAEVELPGYFETLNKDFRYQFFPMKGAMPNLHIGKRIENNRFIIAGGTPSGSVSWMVTGIRQDPYILANPIEVEVEKGPDTIVDKGECIFKPLCE